MLWLGNMNHTDDGDTHHTSLQLAAFVAECLTGVNMPLKMSPDEGAVIINITSKFICITVWPWLYGISLADGDS